MLINRSTHPRVTFFAFIQWQSEASSNEAPALAARTSAKPTEPLSEYKRGFAVTRRSNASRTVMSTRVTKGSGQNADSDSAGPSFCTSNKLPGDVVCWSWTRFQRAVNGQQQEPALMLCSLEVQVLFLKSRENMVWISLPREGS